jgi:hypothetical protein
MLVFINVYQKDPQAHGYRCNFQSRVFQVSYLQGTCEIDYSLTKLGVATRLRINRSVERITKVL